MMNTAEELDLQRQAKTYEQFRPDKYQCNHSIDNQFPAGYKHEAGASHFLRARDSIEKARRDMQRRRQAAARGEREFLSRPAPADTTDRTNCIDRDHQGSSTPRFMRAGGGHSEELYVKMADLPREIQSQLLLMTPDATHVDLKSGPQPYTSAAGGLPYHCHIIREPARLSAQPTPEEIHMSFAQADLAVLMETEISSCAAAAATSPLTRPHFTDLVACLPNRYPPRGTAAPRPAARPFDDPVDAATASCSTRGASPRAPSPLQQLLQRLATSPLNRTHAVLNESHMSDATSDDATLGEEEEAEAALLEGACRNLVTLSLGLGEGPSSDTMATGQARHSTDHASSSRQDSLMKSLAVATGLVRRSTDHASSSRQNRLMNRLEQLQALASSGSAPASVDMSSWLSGRSNAADVTPDSAKKRDVAADVSRRPSFCHSLSDIADDNRDDDINSRSDISTSQMVSFKRTYEVPVWTHSNRSKRNRNASAASSSSSTSSSSSRRRRSLNPQYDLLDQRRDQRILRSPHMALPLPS